MANDVFLAEEDVLTNKPARNMIRETKDDLSTLSHKITVLTLASYFLGNEESGHVAANMIRLYFLSEFPNRNMWSQNNGASFTVVTSSTFCLTKATPFQALPPTTATANAKRSITTIPTVALAITVRRSFTDFQRIRPSEDRIIITAGLYQTLKIPSIDTQGIFGSAIYDG